MVGSEVTDGDGGLLGSPHPVCPLQVLERLLLVLPPPSSGEQKGGSLLVALAAEGDLAQSGCTITVAAAGDLTQGIDTEALLGATLGVPVLPGVPHVPAPCCGRILHQARLCLAFQLCAPPDCVRLRRFLHKASVVRPEVEFHLCVSMNGAVASHSYGRESAWTLEGVRLRVQSWHFVLSRPTAPAGAPPCSRIHPTLGPPIRLRVPPTAVAAGLGGELSLVPAAALCPCLRRAPNRPCRLDTIALFLFDPAGLPAAAPRFFQDPFWVADWEQFGFSATPRAQREGEEELVTPDATYTVQQGAGGPDGDQHPQSLLLFLFLQHEDPFQAYDDSTRPVLLQHLEQTLWSSRPALARGLRTLVHPMLGELRRRHEAQQRLARSLCVALDAVTAVVTGSTSTRFRRGCLRAMQGPHWSIPVCGAGKWRRRKRRRMRRGRCCCRRWPNGWPKGQGWSPPLCHVPAQFTQFTRSQLVLAVPVQFPQLVPVSFVGPSATVAPCSSITYISPSHSQFPTGPSSLLVPVLPLVAVIPVTYISPSHSQFPTGPSSLLVPFPRRCPAP
ncbi:type 2 DNA topoisomerase 6 subunit B-like [Neopsephotus bourkii]|uniref:type 2 DNA topoisomerase 6 subunit B-like n=1 Tax=Neopsephotus bourkii TaxID=309878 RepID=UPI002AA4FC13|nr:type 2 DNA topoisomerase 6 subunit B-like [Neopsephotus bourkii]